MKRRIIIVVVIVTAILLMIIIGLIIYVSNSVDSEAVPEVVSVSEIDLYGNRTFYLSEIQNMSVEILEEIKKLDMHDTGEGLVADTMKKHKEFPPIISKLINLEWLDCSGNDISDLTPIKDLTHLQKIDLTANEVSDWKKFENFTNLIFLDISGNKIFDLKGIERLKNLQQLNLLKNFELSDFKGIENLTELKNLTIGYNHIDTFPTEILCLRKLKRLSLQGLYFRSFPDSFFICSSPIECLQMRDMYSFDYSANLSQFHRLKNLRELYLFWDNIPVLNIDFAKCDNLEIFGYAYHKKMNIVDAMSRIFKAPKLKRLVLSDNGIGYLPKEIALCDSLEDLLLSNNKIKKIPMEIIKLKNLKWVDLRNNPIDTVAIKKIEQEMINTEFYYDK